MSGNQKSKTQWRNDTERCSVLARFATSGLSVKAFCRREAISAASFYRWQGVLGGSVARRVELGKPSPRSFIDAGTLHSVVPRSARLEFKLELGEGLVLHLVRG